MSIALEQEYAFGQKVGAQKEREKSIELLEEVTKNCGYPPEIHCEFCDGIKFAITLIKGEANV